MRIPTETPQDDDLASRKLHLAWRQKLIACSTAQVMLHACLELPACVGKVCIPASRK